MLMNYLDSPEERSPSEMHSRVATLREQRTEEAKARLRSSAKVEEFSELQRVAQQRTVLIEDHNFTSIREDTHR